MKSTASQSRKFPMTAHNQMSTISWGRRVGLLVLALTALATGCRDTTRTEAPAVPVDATAEKSDEDLPKEVDASAKHLKVARVINQWGRKPDVDWPAVITLGEMCKLAYEDAPTRRQVLKEFGFREIVLLDSLTKSGFIAGNSDVAVIAFRGTDDRFDWIANGDFRQLADLDGPRRVHSGFGNAYRLFAKQIQDYLKEHQPKHVWVTGHSLGGAMAACCAYELHKQGQPISGVVTFGQPRIGNEALAKYLDSELDDRYLRLMNEGDPVPILPPCFGKLFPAYWHSGRRAWFFAGELFTTEGPTLYAAPDAEGNDHNGDDELDEAKGRDRYSSITEADFGELQQQLRANPHIIEPWMEDPESFGAASGPQSSALMDSVLGFFCSRIDEHKMDAYLTTIRAYSKGK
jgi:pimeloyl-ACP methyl ester carboxylesterase